MALLHSSVKSKLLNMPPANQPCSVSPHCLRHASCFHCLPSSAQLNPPYFCMPNPRRPSSLEPSLTSGLLQVHNPIAHTSSDSHFQLCRWIMVASSYYPFTLDPKNNRRSVRTCGCTAGWQTGLSMEPSSEINLSHIYAPAALRTAPSSLPLMVTLVSQWHTAAVTHLYLLASKAGSLCFARLPTAVVSLSG
jgi:hypothetical protein